MVTASDARCISMATTCFWSSEVLRHFFWGSTGVALHGFAVYASASQRPSHRSSRSLKLLEALLRSPELPLGERAPGALIEMSKE